MRRINRRVAARRRGRGGRGGGGRLSLPGRRAGDREEGRRGGGHEDRRAPSREREARRPGRHDRLHARRELRALGHAQRPGGRRAHARDRQEILGVARGPRPRREHRVVGRQLALEPQAPGGEPRQRIEPVERARELRDNLREAVPLAHVRELVVQHGDPPRVAPPLRGAGHEHDRREDAGDGRRVERVGHPDVRAEPGFTRCLVHRPRPRRRRRRAPHHRPRGEDARREPGRDEERAERPHRGEDRARVDAPRRRRVRLRRSRRHPGHGIGRGAALDERLREGHAVQRGERGARRDAPRGRERRDGRQDQRPAEREREEQAPRGRRRATQEGHRGEGEAEEQGGARGVEDATFEAHVSGPPSWRGR